MIIRKHWFAYVPFFTAALALAGGWVIVMSIIIANNVSLVGTVGMLIILGSSIYGLFSLYLFLYGFVDYYLDTYIITDQRIIDIAQNGLFSRKVSELYLNQIQDVSTDVSNVFGTMLHFGDIIIQTAGERTNFLFNTIGHPYRISKLITDLQEKYNQPDKGDDSSTAKKASRRTSGNINGRSISNLKKVDEIELDKADQRLIDCQNIENLGMSAGQIYDQVKTTKTEVPPVKKKPAVVKSIKKEEEEDSTDNSRTLLEGKEVKIK